MNLNRRTLLGLIGTLAAAFMVGCRPQSVVGWWRRLWSRNSAVASVPPCIVRPEQMEGPYFVDERLHRSDIRSDPSDGSMKEGVPLQVAIRVHEIRGDACTPSRMSWSISGIATHTAFTRMFRMMRSTHEARNFCAVIR